MTDALGEKRQLLTGKSNYLGWSKIIKATLATRKLIIKNEVQPGKDDEAVGIIMQHLSLNIAGDVPDEEGPIVLLDWLKSRYGDINRWDAERDYKEAKMVGIDAAHYLATLDTALAMVKHSGGGGNRTRCPIQHHPKWMPAGILQGFYSGSKKK